MIELVILAFALSMDAFAVSIGLGSKETNKTYRLALFCALYFGLAQGFMPLIGALGGEGLSDWIEGYADWVAFSLLLLIGIKMIKESFDQGIEEDIKKISHRMLFALAIATSIDAMAAGFTIPLMDVTVFYASLVIAMVTALFSAVGVFIGRINGVWLESKAEFLGGIILIAIGIKFVVF